MFIEICLSESSLDQMIVLNLDKVILWDLDLYELNALEDDTVYCRTSGNHGALCSVEIKNSFECFNQYLQCTQIFEAQGVVRFGPCRHDDE